MKKLIYQLSVVWCLALACIVCVGADTPTKKSDPAPTSITDLLSQVAADKTANDNIVVSIAADQKAIADAQAKLAADTKTQADTQSKMAADVAALIAAIQQAYPVVGPQPPSPTPGPTPGPNPSPTPPLPVGATIVSAVYVYGVEPNPGPWDEAELQAYCNTKGLHVSHFPTSIVEAAPDDIDKVALGWVKRAAGHPLPCLMFADATGKVLWTGSPPGDGSGKALVDFLQNGIGKKRR